MKKSGESVLCARCRGTGIVQGPGDSPCFEIGQYCTACETGRQFAEKIADIVSRTLRISRTGVAGR
jgi:hypothetical protein